MDPYPHACVRVRADDVDPARMTAAVEEARSGDVVGGGDDEQRVPAVLRRLASDFSGLAAGVVGIRVEAHDLEAGTPSAEAVRRLPLGIVGFRDQEHAAETLSHQPNALPEPLAVRAGPEHDHRIRALRLIRAGVNEEDHAGDGERKDCEHDQPESEREEPTAKPIGPAPQSLPCTSSLHSSKPVVRGRGETPSSRASATASTWGAIHVPPGGRGHVKRGRELTTFPAASRGSSSTSQSGTAQAAFHESSAVFITFRLDESTETEHKLKERN